MTSETAPAADTRPPEPTVRATRYTVSLLPETDINYRIHAVYVEFRGRTIDGDGELWIVEHNSAQLHPDGTWRDHDYYAWPDLESALQAAHVGVYSAVVNGRTAMDVVALNAAAVSPEDGPR